VQRQRGEARIINETYSESAKSFAAFGDFNSFLIATLTLCRGWWSGAVDAMFIGIEQRLAPRR
jgi:hypothetical protein